MSFDYLIVGNAILGLTTAYRLTQLQPDAEICITGPATRPGSATTAAGAMLGLFGEVTADARADKYQKTHFKLAYHAQILWPDFVEELNSQLEPADHIQIHPNGTFILLNAQNATQNDAPNYTAIRQALKEYNEPHSEVKPADIPGLFPAKHSQTLGGIYIPGERSVDPVSVLNALEKILRKRRQVTYLDATASKLLTTQQNGHRIQGVTLNNGDKQTAKQVIIAAGTGSQHLIDTLPVLKGRIPHIMTGEGTSFSFDQAPLGKHMIEYVLRTPNRAGACSLHVVPNIHNNHALYLGASNMMHWRHPTPDTSIKSATQLMQGSLNEISKHLKNAKLLKCNQGNRPTSIDGYPLFGASTLVAGLWFLTGTGRDGFQRAPLLSQQIAKKLTGESNLSETEKQISAMLETFTPERLPLQTHSQEESVQHIQREIYSALYKNDGLKPDDTHPHFSKWIMRDIHNLYEQLETDLAISPVVVLSILRHRFSIDTIKGYLDAAKQAWSQN